MNDICEICVPRFTTIRKIFFFLEFYRYEKETVKYNIYSKYNAFT